MQRLLFWKVCAAVSYIESNVSGTLLLCSSAKWVCLAPEQAIVAAAVAQWIENVQGMSDGRSSIATACEVACFEATWSDGVSITCQSRPILHATQTLYAIVQQPHMIKLSKRSRGVRAVCEQVQGGIYTMQYCACGNMYIYMQTKNLTI